MTGDNEMIEIERIISRMIARYPEIAPDTVEHTVLAIYRRLDGGRIRDYIPLLVEKAARKALTEPQLPTVRLETGLQPTPLPHRRQNSPDALGSSSASVAAQHAATEVVAMVGAAPRESIPDRPDP